jgi:hypothetical protein
LSAQEQRNLTEALVDFVDRFGLDNPEGAKTGRTGTVEPAVLMIRLANRLRYRGAFLLAEEQAQLAGEAEDAASAGSDAALALRWHDQVRRFADDRHLPEDFAQGPPRWQLATLIWSFHREDHPEVVRMLDRGTPAEVIHALADVLAIDVPLPATSLGARHPALKEYREFLGRLPRR